MTTLQRYLREVGRIFARGDATEHTYRPALKILLESLGTGLVATNEPRRIECGAPDFIVTRNGTPLGYVEAKDVGEPLGRAERSEQLKRYRDSLANLILTDYLSFRWYVKGELRLHAMLGEVNGDGRSIATRVEGLSDVEFLLNQFRLTHTETVSNPRELAYRLAGAARLIRSVVRKALRHEGRQGPLRRQLDGFRQVLLPDLDPEYFSDIYAETIVYGLFAACCNSSPGEVFSRRTAAFDLPRTNPFLRRLFNEIAGADLDDRVAWIVDDVADLLHRTDIVAVLDGFGRSTRREDPVFHFYETFLAAYDPTMRETRGVYYTPEPVVSYIVRSTDALLRRDFSLRGGLANSGTLPLESPDQTHDHRVLILDPAVGTGTFLRSVIAEIETEVKRSLGDGAWGGATGYVAEHLLPRVFGFELLMAPYTVAHMKLGLQLRESGYDITSDRRLGIYLTNTLEPSIAGGDQYPFVQWLVEEASAASEIKQTKPVMVVLGNPPYSGHSANKGPWISALLRGRDTLSNETTHSYFHIDGHPLGERNPKWLNDDYVKFIRFAQHRIERTGNGILAFISNHGYLDNPTFRAMRKALMATFDEIYVLDLHGSTKKEERSPDGSVDQNVFDIRPGVAIGIFVRHGPRDADAACRVRHAHLWGLREIREDDGVSGERVVGGKYHFLSTSDVTTTAWTDVDPTAPFYSFLPRDPAIEAEFRAGWRLPRIFPVNVLGFQTHRDHFAVAFTREEISNRIAALRDPELSDQRIKERYGLKDSRERNGWTLSRARARVSADAEWERAISECLYRPFDTRWCYLSGAIMDRPRRELLDHVARRENICLLSSRQQGTLGYRHAWVSRDPANDCVVSTRSREANYVFPVYLYPIEGRLEVDERGEGRDGRRSNVSPEFIGAASEAWGIQWTSDGARDLARSFGPEDVVAYVYGILHIPSYRARYADFLREDFPHIPLAPLPLARELIAVGRELIALHLLESDVTSAVRLLGQGVVGTVRYVPEETEDDGAIRLNSSQTLEPVPLAVWEYQVGGFYVVQKWLKDRKGLELSANDVIAFQRMAGAIERTLELVLQLEELIDNAGGLPFRLPEANR